MGTTSNLVFFLAVEGLVLLIALSLFARLLDKVSNGV